MFIGFRLFGFLGIIAFASVAGAEEYRLAPGDVVEVRRSGADEEVSAIVDANGQIRLIDVGGITVADLTLDEAESMVEAELVAQGFFVDPEVSLMLVSYAPVIVAGDVLNPGIVEFFPGMTVSSALAMAGGSQVQGLTRTEILRLRSMVENDMKVANLNLARAVADLAYHQARLADDPVPVTVDPALRPGIPAPGLVNLDGMISERQSQLDALRERTRTLLEFWESEIATIENQRENFDARISVQDEIVASTAEALAAAQKLSQRGLQTASNLSAAEQREADARSKVLELEAAKINATRAIASAQRERVQYLAAQRQEALDGVNDAREQIALQTISYEEAVEQVSILSSGSAAAVVASQIVGLEFEIQSRRSDSDPVEEITMSTPVRPGDTLLVAIRPLEDGVAN
ncbi:polysaccharide biosynthesis/export family protein [Salipiger bermudensis]|uniref:polysaccharide biosynthesis/export family protein n=1 Tax=Salipiger bermudensis TaxID=344736 RepID=UPI001CD7C69D|nr:polysaccharide biosynthesis/export family protein [Salipiger bermudensis]MCA0964014.1 polysaccharide biosynthesis/export family protein [Salipiger bermudensis]